MYASIAHIDAVMTKGSIHLPHFKRRRGDRNDTPLLSEACLNGCKAPSLVSTRHRSHIRLEVTRFSNSVRTQQQIVADIEVTNCIT
jgi:hypothetical protein